MSKKDETIKALKKKNKKLRTELAKLKSKTKSKSKPGSKAKPSAKSVKEKSPAKDKSAGKKKKAPAKTERMKVVATQAKAEQKLEPAPPRVVASST